VVLYKSTNISEKHSASTNKVKEQAKQENSLIGSCCFLDSCLAHSLNLKMKAVCSSEALVDFYQITQRHICEDGTLQSPLLEPQFQQQVIVVALLQAVYKPLQYSSLSLDTLYNVAYLNRECIWHNGKLRQILSRHFVALQYAEFNQIS
jgi:hypothetical protein